MLQTVMEDLLSLTFASDLTLQAMEPRLAGSGALAWQSRENATDGFYLRGLTPNGVKVRLLARETRFVAEVWFPVGPGWPRFTDAQKEAFVKWLVDLVLPAAGAKEIAGP
jgi:hypothetical protein